MTFNFNYPNGSPADRGWGPGWPNCQTAKAVPLVVDGVSFPGGIREELRELAERLVRESLQRGYLPGLDNPGCWGGGCRPTKDSRGNLTDNPSNHSWYTALDINAPHNVFGSSTHQIPQAMADLWRQYGWRWLGPPIRDWMHFDFAGSPADAKDMLNKARAARLGEEDDVTGDELLEGIIAFNQGGPEPKDGPALKVFRALTVAANSHAASPAHDHPHTHSIPGQTTGKVIQP